MKTIIKSIFMALLFSAMSQFTIAATSGFYWDSTTDTTYGNHVIVDDNGGRDSDYEYVFDNEEFVSDGNLIISDGTVVDHADFPDSDEEEVYPYNFDHDQSGIVLFTSDLGFDAVDALFAADLSPLTPLHFSGHNTGFDIDQMAYVENDSDFVIYEFKITNTATEAKPVYAALVFDWDVYSSDDNESGFDDGNNFVYQYNTVNGYGIGLASLVNAVDQYRLGYCCALTDSTFDEESGFSHMADPYAFAKGFLFDTLATEQCDDGNNDNGDGCSADCQTETVANTCGNGEIETGESCDDGNTVADDGCGATCLSEDCGNGTVDTDEECDDGNTDNNDGCSAFCKNQFYEVDNDTYCGDGFVNNGGTGDQSDAAQSTDLESGLSVLFTDLPSGEARTAAFCMVAGQGTDGTDESVTDVTNKIADCADYYETNIAICGNGVQNAGEECDDGNVVSDDGCSSDCTVDEDLAICGDATVDAEEECDDGNVEDGDGCSSTCTTEEEDTGGGSGCTLISRSNTGHAQGTTLLLCLSIALLGVRKKWV